MNGAAQAHNVTKLDTLADLNKALSNSGFPAVTIDQMKRLKELETRERIQRAILILHHDNGAQAFITDLFTKAGIYEENVNSQGHQANAQRQRPSPAAPAPSNYREASQGEPNRAPAQNRQAGPAQQQHPADSTQEPRRAKEERRQLHIYGGKGALCLEADSTRSDFVTFALEGAVALQPRSYDWANKIRIQITRAELPTVAAVLVGALNRCEFKNHGPQKNKGFSIERQPGNKLYVQIFAAGASSVAVPVMAPDQIYFGALVMRQLQMNMPWMDMLSLNNFLYTTYGNG